MLRIIGFCSVFIFLLGCGKSEKNVRQKRATAAAIHKLSDTQTEIVEPRYLFNGQYIKFWSRGEPFSKVAAAPSFPIHASGICVLILGSNWVFEDYIPSNTIAVGELGAIVSNKDGSNVNLLDTIEFWVAENNYWISSLKCRRK